MAEKISKIRLPSGNVYEIADETARDSIPTKTSQLENDNKFVSYTDSGEDVPIAGKEPLYQDVEYKDLVTKNKTIIAAINDAAKSGGGGGDVPDDIVLWTEPVECTVPSTDRAFYKDVEYPEFDTENKTVFGAVNELAARHICCTQAEYDAMPQETKARTFFYIIEED